MRRGEGPGFLVTFKGVIGLCTRPPNLARRLLQRLEQAADKADPVAEHKEKLSDREKGVLKMVAAGYTSGEIGCNLLISSQTVSTHLKNIYRKLQVKTRAQAVMYAAQRGLV